MNTQDLKPEVVAAIAEAKKNGDVSNVFIGGPSPLVLRTVQREVEKTFPHARFKTKLYEEEEDDSSHAGYRD